MSENAANQTPEQASNQSSAAPQEVGYDAWSSNIPTEFKSEGYWSNFKDKPLSEVLKSFGHAQKYMGSSIRVPSEETDTEGWNKVWSKLGRPESADKYDVKLPAISGAKFNWSEEAVKGFKEMAYQHGMSNKALQNVMNWYGARLEKQIAAQQAEEAGKVKATRDKLTGEWGTNFEPKIELAKRAARHYFGEGSESIVDAAFADGENFIRGLVQMGELMNESSVVHGNPNSFKGISKETAAQQIAKISADTKHAYHNAKDPGHAAAKADMENLFKIAYPEGEYYQE